MHIGRSAFQPHIQHDVSSNNNTCSSSSCVTAVSVCMYSTLLSYDICQKKGCDLVASLHDQFAKSTSQSLREHINVKLAKGSTQSIREYIGALREAGREAYVLTYVYAYMYAQVAALRAALRATSRTSCELRKAPFANLANTRCSRHFTKGSRVY